MKEKLKIFKLLFFLLILTNSGKSQIDENRNKHYYHEIDTFLANPHKGIMPSAWTPNITSRFAASVGYRRFDWGELEPQKNIFNWQLIDTLLSNYSSKGMKLTFRIMTANPQEKGYSSTPLWVFEEGCRSHDYVSGGAGTYQGGNKITRKEPDYGDPIYLSEHTKFLEALAKRYDGNPNIEYIGIGSYGIWSEWHTPNPASLDVRIKIIDMYVQNFKKTQLIMLAADNEALPYALSKGTGWERDGLGSLWDIESCKDPRLYPPELMNEAWKNAPVAFEWYGDYPFMAKCDHCSFDEGLKFAIANHGTYIRDNLNNMPDSVMTKFRKIGMKLGYNFILNEISNNKYTKYLSTFHITSKITNNGIAPLYAKYYLRYSLIDVNENVVFYHTSYLNVKSLLPGTYIVEDDVTLAKNILPGYYRIGISFVNAETGISDIKLPINAFEKNCIYEVSEVIVK